MNRMNKYIVATGLFLFLLAGQVGEGLYYSILLCALCG